MSKATVPASWLLAAGDSPALKNGVQAARPPTYTAPTMAAQFTMPRIHFMGATVAQGCDSSALGAPLGYPAYGAVTLESLEHAESPGRRRGR